MGTHFISISHFRSVGRLMMWHQLTNNFSDANKTSKDVSCSSGIQSVKGRHKLTVPTISFSELNASPGHLSDCIQILCSQTLRNVFVFVTTQNLKYQDLDFDFLSFSNAKKKKKNWRKNPEADYCSQSDSPVDLSWEKAQSQQHIYVYKIPSFLKISMKILEHSITKYPDWILGQEVSLCSCKSNP